MSTILTGEHFISGNDACAEGAIAAGCRFFAGYPITPSSEIIERLARRLPQVGGMCIQMEDEMASMAAILGAAWGGKKSMTATSGPGFSLMQENIGLGMITETPCVVVNVQRGGPSTGLPTLVGQSDMMQAKWGSHGDYEVIAFSPSSPQEMFDYTIKAFNLSEKYRMPVFVLADEVTAHMVERVRIPKKKDLMLYSRKKHTTKNHYLPFKPGGNLVPSIAHAGDGYQVHVTGLTHNERGYPVIDAETENTLVRRLLDKVRKNAEDIIEVEEKYMDDAEACIVAYGITARCAAKAVRDARKEGIKAGMLRLITPWPFSEHRIKQLTTIDTFIVPEINYGQIVREVERCVIGANIIPVTQAPGGIIPPAKILKTIRKAK